jgi:hypothetical protein
MRPCMTEEIAAAANHGRRPRIEVIDVARGLPMVYAVWIVVVVSLYPLCRWYAGVRRRRHDWWLRYL